LDVPQQRPGGIVEGRTNHRDTMAESTQIPVDDERESESEQAKVESWRLHVLIEAGYPLALAERLAISVADLHECVELVRLGCNPVTAAEILL
jgi:hypothetical protein